MDLNDNDEVAAERAEWLAALASALAQARRLIAQPARWQADSAEAVMLRVRIKAVAAEVESLRGVILPDAARLADTPLWTKAAAPPQHDRVPRS